jgi:2-polyprenyl-3-methyl-5-hydroxy-6-metoxy-1,4-benzoquinol methylase
MIKNKFHSQVYKKDLVYEKKSRYIKTKKIVSILKDASKIKLDKLNLLDVGCAAGLISMYLSRYFRKVVGTDIDEEAILQAKKIKVRNLSFKLLNSDGTFPFKKNSFDVIVANQIYEHVKSPKLLINEINRVLKPNGICFFGAGNRLVIKDAHYPNLPFVSWFPILIADYYVRIFKYGSYYEPRLKTVFGIKKMLEKFTIEDYTLKIIKNPNSFYASDVISENSLVSKLPNFILNILYFIIPNYLLILRKK